MSTTHTISQRAEELFKRHVANIWQSTDRLFGYVMVAQYVVAIIWALVRGPLTWEGTDSSIHPHVFMALGLGGLISLPAIFLAFCHAGKPVTRWMISISQFLMSAVLIDISGGRIETHFHIFVSFAFISLYRDWRLLIPGTLVTLADHILLGIYSPIDIYGVAAGAQFRFVEHAAWVVFEDVVLAVACIRGMDELRVIALNQADVESSRQASEDANRAKSLFLANMSHELRTPMNAVIGFADLLQNPAFGQLQPKQEKFVEQILTSGKHLLGLINGVLDLAKIESGTLEFRFEDFDVATTLREVAQVLEPLAAEKQIKLIVSEVDSAPIIHADPAKFRQVLYNLINNAIKFSGPETTVSLSAMETDGSLVEIAVQDQGVGILPDDCERIFQRFEQVDNSYSRTQQGTGLGLAICQSIVELHGGRIWVESKGEGAGSTFKFNVPAAVQTVVPVPRDEILSVSTAA